MAEKLEVDVAIAGAGTSGAYLAWKLAGAGFSCAVLESEALDFLGTQIGPFHMEETAFEQFGIPKPEGAELLHFVTDMTMFSPGLTSSNRFHFPTLVMDKPLFIQRLQSCAVEAGACILENTRVAGLIFERGFLRGLRAEGEGGGLEVRARLVIDASGIDGAVRTMMPPGPWFESDRITDEDTIFVYMETWRDIEGDLGPGVSSYPFYQGWCAPGPGDTRIVGIGMAGSFEAAEERHRRFVKTLPFTGSVVAATRGRIPYRRPPLSLADNGLMIVGDAAMMNKPFSGEGVTSAFTACVIAAEVASRALESDDVTRESLWEYNKAYFSGQGAKFAFLTALLPSVMSISAEEMDFFMGIPGMLTEESSQALQRDYVVQSDTKAALAALPEIVKGLAAGRIRVSSLARLGFAGVVALALKSLYEKYPDHPMGFAGWARIVRPLWQKVDRSRHRFFASIL